MIIITVIYWKNKTFWVLMTWSCIQIFTCISIKQSITQPLLYWRALCSLALSKQAEYLDRPRGVTLTSLKEAWRLPSQPFLLRPLSSGISFQTLWRQLLIFISFPRLPKIGVSVISLVYIKATFGHILLICHGWKTNEYTTWFIN